MKIVGLRFHSADEHRQHTARFDRNYIVLVLQNQAQPCAYGASRCGRVGHS